MQLNHDPFRHCEGTCNHDLAPGVLVADLLRGDGPHPPLLVIGFGSERERLAVVRDEPLPAAG